MLTYPTKIPLSRPDSNLDSSLLTKRMDQETARRNSIFKKLNSAFVKSTKSLLTKNDWANATSLAREAKASYNAEVLKLNGDVDRIGKIKQQIQQNLNRQFIKTIPNAKKILALNKTYTNECKKLFQQRARTAFNTNIKGGLQVDP